MATTDRFCKNDGYDDDDDDNECFDDMILYALQ